MNGIPHQVIDQMGRVMAVPTRPRRIISLVPSQTELLFDLGLDREIVGLTRFCVHPADRVQSKQRVGGTKRIDFRTIDRLQPDLIIGNKEENERADILKLAESYPVWMSDVVTLDGALDMIRQVGRIVAKPDAADQLTTRIDAAFAALQPLNRPLRVAYLVWQKPFMVAGHDTFIDDMLGRCGMENAFAARNGGRYPEVTAEDVKTAELDAILLSSEPFPFNDKHRTEFADCFPGVPVYLVNGEMFSWYGSRLLLAVDYLEALLATLE
ncbi:MAG: iron ABC transporter [Gemmatimonas sp. SG8_17]|nr:MAG: iron ABC transporter [Gemmatimonas sp. SG8_17]